MIGNHSMTSNVFYDNDNNGPCMYDNFRKALKILLNFKYLDLTIDVNTAHYGLRFYTAFNRLDAVGGIVPKLESKRLITLKASINTPVGYDPRFNNINRDTILPICELRAVAFVVQEGRVRDLLRELRKNYTGVKSFSKDCSCNMEVLNLLIKDEGHSIWQLGVRAFDRSNNPIAGRVVAYDSEILWIQSVATDIPQTFYIVPLENITFLLKQ